MPQEIQAHREPLRREYLRWLHEIGLCDVRGRPLRDRVLLRPSLSYWWMSVPACYSLDPNSPVYNVIRLGVLERLASEWGADTVTLLCDGHGPTKLLRNWARETGRSFSNRHVQGHGSAPSTYERLRIIKSAVLVAIPPLGALSVLLSIGKQPGFRRSQIVSDAESTTVMIDYLAHLGQSPSSPGTFSSNFWGPVVGLVQQSGCTNWLHQSANRPARRSLLKDVKVLDSWEIPDHVRHDLLHAGATFRIKARATRDYLRVICWGLSLRRKRKIFSSDKGNTSHWLAFRGAFRDEWYGVTAMLNCLYLNLLEDYLTKLPRADLGIYILENQPWEMALLHAWRAAGHGKLVGFAHSTVLYWNTRIFKDPRDLWAEAGPGGLPCPDLIAVNGPPMRDALETGGYPASRLVDVEAVRFTETSVCAQGTNGTAPSLLILGEYSLELTTQMLKFVELAVKASKFPGRILFRDHPTRRFEQVSSSSWFDVDQSDSGSRAIKAADLVVCGALTSAAVEAILAGRPTFLIADGRVLPCSPADSLDPTWVLSPRTLTTELERLQTTKTVGHGSGVDSYFFANGMTRRWVNLLSTRGGQT